MYGRLVEHIIRDQLVSLGIAVAVVFALIAVLFRSASRVVAALAANVPVIALLGAVMVWLRIPLDVATVTVAPALLGLVVDDTVHVLNAPHFRLPPSTRSRPPARSWHSACSWRSLRI